MFFIIALQCVLFSYVHTQSEHPILLVVSYDGFRYDYLKKNITPHLERLKDEGTYTDYLINVFPTKTFPNHFTIATGLYPEVHGVVGNSFYDPNLGKIVQISAEMFSQNPLVVPIWILNEDAGDRRYSGSMMWTGGPYPYQNKTPTYVQDYDTNIDFYKRIDTVISWLTDREKPANLVMLYLEDPDLHSHIYGPDSDTVFNIIKRLDNITQYLEDQLVKHKLVNKVNVIHTSDHGMIGVGPSNFINITAFLNPGTYMFADSSPVLHVIPKKGYESEVYNRLLKAARSSHFKVYKKEELLSRWKYKNNPRIPPILLLAEKGYAFQDVAEYAEEYKNKYHIPVTLESRFGVHGYDNEMPEMHPFFMARGPKIKKGHVVQPFSVLDLYGLFAEILEIKPAPYNRSNSAGNVLIVNKSNRLLSTILITVGGVLLSLVLISIAAGITVILIKRQQNITTAAALKKRFPQTFHQSIEAQHLLDVEDA